MKKIILLLLVAVSAFCPAQHHSIRRNVLSKTTEKNLPNILFILADDLGYGDVHTFNTASKIPTPVLDNLANEGIKFTDAHATGSWCVPSRYGLLTGQFPVGKNMDVKKGALIAQDRLTLASLLQRNGYFTAMIGKWHLGFDGISDWNKVDYSKLFNGGPLDRGFNYFFGMHASLDIPPYFFIKNKHPVAAPAGTIPENQSVGATSTISGAFWREGKIAPDFKHEEVLATFANKAISFMEEHQKQQKEQPFFLYLSLTAPHTPWLPREQFRGKSRAGQYGDFVMQVDHTIGEVLNTLEMLNIKNETLVIFTSDNGPVWFKEDIQKFNHKAAGPYRGMKLDAYEGAHRIPFIARWPGKINPHTSSKALVSFTDMLATFAAVVKDTISDETSKDSYNLLPDFLNKGVSKRRGLIVEGHTIREDNWKLIIGNGTGSLQKQWGHINVQPIEGELYNLKKDQTESNNLYKKYPLKVAELRKRMEQYKIRK